MKKHIATYRRLHELNDANKPSSNKGGGESKDHSVGEFLLGAAEEGMLY
jgi:hypothetical protein